MASETFVLVHGAWHGGWCWRRVVPLLRAAGHEVFTPTLTGLGERAHLARPDVDLDVHTEDITRLIEAEELEDVTLVGHSYAGFIVTGVADRAGARLKRLVYLDAFVPENGKSLLDYIPPDRQASYRDAAAAGRGLPCPFPLAAFGLTDPADAAWVSAHLTDHPARTMAQPLALAKPPGNGLPRSFIYCSAPAMGMFDGFAAAVRAAPGWTFAELQCGHDAMVVDPEGLARVLQQAG